MFVVPRLHMIKNKTIAEFIQELGDVFASFLLQDSGNKSYSVHTPHGPKWIKHLNLDQTPIGDVKAIIQFYNSLQSQLIPRNWELVELSDGQLMMSDWVPGQVLNSPAEDRQNAQSTYQRFIRLPLAKRLHLFDRILQLFVEIEEINILIEDFYDGCLIYDFDTHTATICDLDHLHVGEYRLNRDRQLGSSRFMAPEEFVRGSLIDRRTNVFTMGATGFVLLNDNKRAIQDWHLPIKLHGILQKAIAHKKEDRFASVAELYQEMLDRSSFLSYHLQ